MNERSPVDLTQPDMLQKLDKYMKPLIRPFVYKWAITQVRKGVSRPFPRQPPLRRLTCRGCCRNTR